MGNHKGVVFCKITENNGEEQHNGEETYNSETDRSTARVMRRMLRPAVGDRVIVNPPFWSRSQRGTVMELTADGYRIQIDDEEYSHRRFDAEYVKLLHGRTYYWNIHTKKTQWDAPRISCIA